MKRRLEIARGFLHTPKILFLDEPTLGLDPQSRNQLWTHVKHLNQTEGVTVFLTTHYMDEADRVAQRIGIIDHGRIVAQGTPAGTQAANQQRIARTGFPGAYRVNDSRRGCDLSRSDATVREDVEALIDGRNLRALAARSEEVQPVPRADYRFVRPTPVVPAASWVSGLVPYFNERETGVTCSSLRPA